MFDASATNAEESRVSPSRWHVWAWPALAAVAVGAFLLTVLGQYAVSYRLWGDDFALVRYSSSPAVAEHGMGAWFSSGYAGYFDNYPDWTSVGTPFVRPLVNSQFFAASHVERLIGDSAYLLPNYLWVVLLGFGVARVLPLYAPVSRRLAALAGIAVGLSSVTHPALLSANMATNLLALVLCVFALLLLDPATPELETPRIVRCSLLLSAGVLAHETVVFGVLAAAALMFAFSPRRPRLRDMAWFLVPLGVFAFVRVYLDVGPSPYSLSLGFADLIVRIRHFLVGPLVPYYQIRFLENRALLSSVEWAVWLSLLAANGIVALGIMRGLISRDTTQLRLRAGLVAALSFVAVPAVLMDASPRFMGLTLVVGLIGALSLSRSARWSRIVVTSVLISSSAMFWLQFVPAKAADLESVRYAGAYADYVRDSIARVHPDTVLLVNDPVGMYAARAMVELQAEPLDVEVIVLNNLEGPTSGAVRFEVASDTRTIRVTNEFGSGQRAVFVGNTPDFAASSSGFRYSGDLVNAAVEGLLTAAGPLPAGRTLLIGVDPRDGTFLPGRLYQSVERGSG